MFKFGDELIVFKVLVFVLVMSVGFGFSFSLFIFLMGNFIGVFLMV